MRRYNATQRSQVGVGITRSARRYSVKLFERSNGLDTSLYKNIPLPFTFTYKVVSEKGTTDLEEGSGLGGERLNTRCCKGCHMSLLNWQSPFWLPQHTHGTCEVTVDGIKSLQPSANISVYVVHAHYP